MNARLKQVAIAVAVVALGWIVGLYLLRMGWMELGVLTLVGVILAYRAMSQKATPRACISARKASKFSDERAKCVCRSTWTWLTSPA